MRSEWTGCVDYLGGEIVVWTKGGGSFVPIVFKPYPPEGCEIKGTPFFAHTWDRTKQDKKRSKTGKKGGE